MLGDNNKLGPPDEIDCYHNDYPMCPYCGHEDTEWWESISLDKATNHEVVEVDCPKCDKTYRVEVVKEPCFNTSPIGGWNRSDI